MTWPVNIGLQFRRFRSGGTGVTDYRRNTDQTNLREESGNPETSESPTLPFRLVSEPNATLPSIYSESRQRSAATDDAAVESVVPALSHGRRASRSKDAEDDPLGLSLVYSAPNSDADLIFVHGLGGSSYRTWSWERKVDNFWPAWIRHEQGLSHFRVFSFGYNANFTDSNNPLSILDFSKGLLVRMRTYSQGDESSSIGLVRLDTCLPIECFTWPRLPLKLTSSETHYLYRPFNGGSRDKEGEDQPMKINSISKIDLIRLLLLAKMTIITPSCCPRSMESCSFPRHIEALLTPIHSTGSSLLCLGHL